ncbi:MAG: hypothetical protein F4138_07850 [Acidimicrobiia bacterium]|nr:hypothetical protein [Acidimicrobiia bacterium]MYC57584.1 hypothetical protein [Acidimicrobiia bacterium]MYG94874.1 hypothetical protein [Acidimicrobiia bacterium]MYI31285.1 hypothetical protein [Acidimicrobiia bacterium]
MVATNKRERQRQRRQVARRQAKAVATRSRIRSSSLKLALVVVFVVLGVLILWLLLRDGGDDASNGDTSSETNAADVDLADVEGSQASEFPTLVPPPSPGGELSGEVTPCPDPEGPDFRVTSFEAAPSECLDSALEYAAVFDTTLGKIRVALDTEANVEAVNAFVVLADYDYYNNTAFFYTDPEGGYIQGGSPKTNDANDPGPGFSLTAPSAQDFGASELLWSAEGPTTGQLVFTVGQQFSPSQPIFGLTRLGLVSDGVDVISQILASHVDNPDTTFGGRPAETVEILSVQIQTIDPALEGSIDLSNCPPSDGSGPTILDFDAPQPMCLDVSKQYTAVFDTTAGEMRVALDMLNTPNTANNFAVLARYHYYDNTLLFRTDPSIGIIQGGAPHTNSPADPGPGYTILDEGLGFTYEPGQIVMARTAEPNSASAQFFFAVNENTALLNDQGTYVVFGQMDEDSLVVAESILDSHVDQPNNPLGGGPDPQVIVNSVTIHETG